MLIKLLWVLPTVFSFFLIEAAYIWGFWIPTPFMATAAGVAIAGAWGGRGPGLLAATVAALTLLHAYIAQFFPTPLTESLSAFVVTILVYFAAAYFLGGLRDQRDASINALREIERNLSSSLLVEVAAKQIETAKVADRDTRLEAANRLAGIGHFSFDARSGNCTFCSEQHAANLGVTAVEFQRMTTGREPQLKHIHPDDHQLVLTSIHQLSLGKGQTFEYRAFHPGNEVRFIRQIEEPVFDEAGNVIEHFGTSMDMTELRLAEIRLRQSQRIEAIGTLTGGVAHDFNNLLAIILGNLELCLDAEKDLDRQRFIQNSIRATLRGASLTKNLLSFSRRAHLKPIRLNLNQVVQDTLDWGNRVLPEIIKVNCSLATGLEDVDLDSTSIENALLNLLLNARDAMPEGGEVTIRTKSIEIPEDDAPTQFEGIQPGHYVQLSICDTGHGISPDEIEEIFEPFYTDKPVGQGSGLGLSMVHGFIEQSSGAIRVHSEVGVGTTFDLYFKAVEGEPASSKSEHNIQATVSKVAAKILLVEDEVDVMRVIEQHLNDAGYSVVTAENGDEALGIFNTSEGFDLLLTDVVMPGKLQGPALAEALQMKDPKLSCILLSGYATNALVPESERIFSHVRLSKPVLRKDLLKAVAQALQS